MAKNNESKQVITRFPPSPTGNLHIGGARTALFNYLFARKYGGKMYFRIEDTDKARSKKEFEQNIVDSLSWLGISYDGAPMRQSDRGEVYKKYLLEMVDKGFAYISKEEPKEAGQNSEVVRFKNPNKKIIFEDVIRGTIEFDTSELKDFIIAKNIDEPLYHLAVVVDDFETEVSHVIRGEDGISNTPRQILIQEALGAPRPIYAHLPLVLDSSRAKLSKRKHGEKVTVSYYKDRGYLPPALINYLALLGWNPGEDEEIFMMSDLIEKFQLERAQKAGAIFNEEKLRWVNKEHIKRTTNYQLPITNEIRKYFPDSDKKMLEKIAPIVFERIEVLGDIKTMVEEGELGYFFDKPEYSASELCWKSDSKDETKKYLAQSVSLLEKIGDEDFTEISVKDALFPYAEEMGKGSVLWPIRFALSGKEKSPDPFSLASVLGKEETIRRMKLAIEKLSS